MLQRTIRQIIYFALHYVKCERAAKERLYAPLLFASTLLVIFNFSFDGKITRDYSCEIFVAEVFITFLFAMQLSFLRQFDIETEDNAFDHLRLHQVSSYSLFMGKYLVSLVTGLVILIPTVLLAFFFHLSVLSHIDLNWQFCVVMLLVLAGISTLGCLISSLIQKMNGREALYPLLFYPLACPLFLVGLQSAYISLTSKEGANLMGILLGLDFIYLVLSLLLFDEIMD